MNSASLGSGVASLRDVPRWLRRDPVRLVAVGAIFAIVIPVIVFGPWLPLLDLVGFVGMYSYPPQESYGPLHYYVFQFSYAGVLILSRLCCDLHLPTRFQIPLFFLTEMGVSFAVIYAILKRLVADPWTRAVGVALGSLALWDGIFLWGGPLAHSLSACCLTAATFFVIRGAAEPGKDAAARILALLLFAVCCHPFAFPFALVVCGVRFLFHRERRLQTALFGAAVLLFGFIIYRDSPPAEVGTAAGSLKLLFGVSPAEIAFRIRGLFTQDEVFATLLFGATPISSEITFLLFAAIHLTAFIAAPIFAWRQGETWRRMLATLTTVGAGLYLFSWDSNHAPIGEWPQRILTLYAPFTYLVGFLALTEVAAKFRRGISSARSRAAWLVPIGILGFVVTVECQAFRFGPELEANVARTRDQILKSGVENAYVVVSGLDNVHPFFLRAIPFVLFSDPAVVARGININTEWHVKPRHPTRVAESVVDFNRDRYLAEFAADKRIVDVQLVQQGHERFPVSERTNAKTWMSPTILAEGQELLGRTLFLRGAYDSALEHFNSVIELRPDYARGWNDGGAALFRTSRFPEAATYFAHAVKADPGLFEARMNLAKALINSDRGTEAVPVLEEYVRVAPTNPQAAKLLAELKAAAAKP